MKVKEIIASDRPRERLFEQGESALSNAELFAIIFGSGSKNNYVLEISNALLSRYNFDQLSKVSIQELLRVKGIGMAKACQIKAVTELAKRINMSSNETFTKVKSPEDIYNIMLPILRHEDQENVFLLCLNSANKIISKKLLFKGTINESIVHPREIFKEAIRQSAVSIILVHNHPSGDPTPSQEDKEITMLIKKLSNMMSLNLLDHVIIASEGFFSFKENGLLNN